MSYEVKFKEATKDDTPTLIDFLGELFELEKDFQPDPERQAAALKLILENPEHAVIYLIQVDEEIAGMVALHMAISTAEGGWCGRIEDLYLKPEFRRRGIGRQAMDNLFAIAKSKGLTRLTLIADKDNLPALQFYEKCGFSEMNLVSFMKRINP